MALSTDQWIQVANAMGTWVAGIGTLAAVIVSLWLARGASRVHLKAQVNVYWIVIPGSGKVPNEECVGFEVVNHGERAVIVSSVGWSIGKRKAKRFAMQNVEARLGADVPKRLEHGERASFMFSLKADWPAYFAGKFIESASLLDTLRGYVSTTVGHTVEIEPAEGLLKRLRQALNDQEGGAR